MQVEIFQTERCLLKLLNPEYLNYLFRNESKETIMNILGHESEADFDKEKHKFDHGYTMYNRSFLFFQIIEKSSNRIIGGCGFHNWFPDHRRAELGYALKFDSDKNKGIMGEVLAFTINYGFEKMNLHRIEAMVGTRNTPSLKLMTKFHFQQEGLLRQHYFTNEVFEDSLVFSKLATD